MKNYLHSYRLLKSSWGIAIDVDASYTSIDDYSDKEHCIKLNAGIWFINKCTFLSKEELQCLMDGVLFIEHNIINSSEHKEKTLIEINDVQYSPTDYQIDGIKVAIIEWASIVFNFKLPLICTSFDKKLNKYLFSYPSKPVK